jgi:hypothetical protein
MVPKSQHGNPHAGEEFISCVIACLTATDNHDLNHQSRRQAWRPDNKNPGCRDRSDTVAGICSRRNFGFGNGARERAHSLSPFCESNEHASQQTNFSCGSFSRKVKLFVVAGHRPPHLNPLPTVGARRITTWSLSSIGHTRSSARIFQESDACAAPKAFGAESALVRGQPKRSNDPLEIIVSIVSDLDPPALFSVVNGYVRREMLLQPIL